VGTTDAGQPIVLPEFSCESFAPGAYPLLNQKICWYCRFSDFRKNTDIMLKRSICHCADNKQAVQENRKNDGT
jgi:hypothetical protein